MTEEPSLEKALENITKILTNLHNISKKQREEIDELKREVAFLKLNQGPQIELMRYNKL